MKSFMSACREHFGLLPGQTPIQFGKEIQALTDKDRQEIADGLKANGIEIDPKTIAKPHFPKAEPQPVVLPGGEQQPQVA